MLSILLLFLEINKYHLHLLLLLPTHKAYVNMHLSHFAIVYEKKLLYSRFFSFSWFSIPAKSSFFSKTTPIFSNFIKSLISILLTLMELLLLLFIQYNLLILFFLIYLYSWSLLKTNVEIPKVFSFKKYEKTNHINRFFIAKL